MKLALLQTQLHWEAPDKNRQSLANELADLAPVDLVVLPEMFTTGFSMGAEALAETMAGPTVSWMQAMARRIRLFFAGR